MVGWLIGILLNPDRIYTPNDCIELAKLHIAHDRGINICIFYQRHCKVAWSQKAKI